VDLSLPIDIPKVYTLIFLCPRIAELLCRQMHYEYLPRQERDAVAMEVVVKVNQRKQTDVSSILHCTRV